MKTVLIIIADLVAASLVLLEVDGKHQFDFRNCGGAGRCLGASRLERLRIRSGHTHKSRDELAKELDDDDDLVSRLALLADPVATVLAEGAVQLVCQRPCTAEAALSFIYPSSGSCCSAGCSVDMNIFQSRSANLP